MKILFLADLKTVLYLLTEEENETMLTREISKKRKFAEITSSTWSARESRYNDAWYHVFELFDFLNDLNKYAHVCKTFLFLSKERLRVLKTERETKISNGFGFNKDNSNEERIAIFMLNKITEIGMLTREVEASPSFDGKKTAHLMCETIKGLTDEQMFKLPDILIPFVQALRNIFLNPSYLAVIQPFLNS